MEEEHKWKGKLSIWDYAVCFLVADITSSTIIGLLAGTATAGLYRWCAIAVVFWVLHEEGLKRAVKDGTR